MAIIEGQSESLKKLKEVLFQNRITRFNSIAGINKFIRSYEVEKNAILSTIQFELSNEINQLQTDLTKHQLDYNKLKSDIILEINSKILEIENTISLLLEKNNKSCIYKVFYYIKVKFLSIKKTRLNNSFDKVISKKTHIAHEHVTELKNKLDNITSNREEIIFNRCSTLSNELDRIKGIIEGLYPLMAGAVGENLVLKELQKLPDNIYVYNDFKAEFYPPIYNRKEDDRIYSIQIDHLIVSQAGVFILETKNWSKDSVESFDLRSPVEQILRSSYAVFVLLNSPSVGSEIELEHHHWGGTQIPVKNLIVMINNKPKVKFNHVKVLSLKELNRYITYFDPIFTSEEVGSICEYLRRV